MRSIYKSGCVRFVLFAAVAIAPHALAQQPATPVARPYVVSFFVAQPAPESTYETGPLHVVYSGGKEFVVKLHPKKRSTEKEVVFNQEGIADVRLADDRQTVGWTETYDNCCTSYSVPLALVIFRSGKPILRIQQGQMVWDWMFLDGGKRVAVVWGTTHGPEVGDYQLYDVMTKRMLSEIYGDADAQQLLPAAPAWAKRLEYRFDHREEEPPATFKP